MDELKAKAWRNDAEAKVTGRARYTDDLKLPGMLHAVPVYGDFVHARLLGDRHGRRGQVRRASCA